jgi:membrane-associated PAP2 superfamily phosphatase
MCDAVLNYALCDNLQGVHVLGANIHQIVFCWTLSVSQWYLISMAFGRFCFIVLFNIPKAVELSVHNGVAG